MFTAGAAVTLTVTNNGTARPRLARRDAAAGSTVDFLDNVDLARQAERRRRTTGVVLPALARFEPNFILVACGLDASMNEPLGRMNLTSECFALMTDRVKRAAARLCEGRLVACHEGGYSSAYVPYCGLAVVECLAGVRTEVVDPWVSDARRVRELPLRAHEAEAIDTAVRRHRLG